MTCHSPFPHRGGSLEKTECFRKRREESFAKCSYFCQEMNNSILLLKEILNA